MPFYTSREQDIGDKIEALFSIPHCIPLEVYQEFQYMNCHEMMNLQLPCIAAKIDGQNQKIWTNQKYLRPNIIILISM